jgi:hypothetical protein
VEILKVKRPAVTCRLASRVPFWIVPLLRSAGLRVQGPYGTLSEAQKAGEDLIVAAQILTMTTDGKPTLEVAGFIRNRYVR